MLTVIKETIFKISSMIFVILYLQVLLFLAAVKYFSSTGAHKDPSVTLSRREKKLTRDISYYIELQGFSYEPYTVTTEDGFILDMGRIRGKDSPGYPVLLIPGLMQSSAAYLTAGPDSIAFELVRMGFDVWLGNNRGGFHGEHAEFKRYSSNKMWQWDMRDLARYDVPKMIDTVLTHVQETHAKCAVAGHSQGTAQTFLALSIEMNPGLADKISSFSALAPAVYAGPLIDRWYLRALRHGPNAWHAMMGYGPFLGPMFSLEKLLPLGLGSKCGYAMFNYLLGWNDLLWDRHYRDRNFIFAPVYVSSKHMFWWLGRGGFADTRCLFDESRHRWFDERFPPCQIFVCGRDELCSGPKLVNRLETLEPVSVDVVDLPTYSHLDVLWAKDAGIEVAKPLGAFIAKHMSNSSAASTAGWEQPGWQPDLSVSRDITRQNTPEAKLESSEWLKMSAYERG